MLAIVVEYLVQNE